jgi:hypothetical protein
MSDVRGIATRRDALILEEREKEALRAEQAAADAEAEAEQAALPAAE